MQFTISCETFSRMAEISRFPVTDIEPYFKGLYFERRSNQLFLVACNRLVAAIEHLGFNEGPDEICCVDASNDHLIKQCDTETPYNGKLEIISDNNLRWAFVKSSMGYNAPNCYLELPKGAKFFTWRDWLPDEMPKKTNGAMHWSAGLIHALAIASPSGQLSFPEFIDTSVPIVINDRETTKWIGIFLGVPSDGITIPATIPDWTS
jgi:hypothetical protein